MKSRGGYTIFRRDPRPFGFKRYVMGDPAGNIVQEFSRYKPAVTRLKELAPPPPPGTFTATLKMIADGIGFRDQPIGIMVLSDVTDEHGERIASKIIFRLGKQLAPLDVRPGDRLQFKATLNAGSPVRPHDFKITERSAKI